MPLCEHADAYAVSAYDERRQPERRLEEQVVAEAGGEPDERARFGPVVVRDRDREHEPEIGHHAEDAQVREHRDLHDDDEHDERAPGARRASLARPSSVSRRRRGGGVVVVVVVVVVVTTGPWPGTHRSTVTYSSASKSRTARRARRCRDRPAVVRPRRPRRPTSPSGKLLFSSPDVTTSSPTRRPSRSRRGRRAGRPSRRRLRAMPLDCRAARARRRSTRDRSSSKHLRAAVPRLEHAADEAVGPEHRHVLRDTRLLALVERDRRLEVARANG